MSKEISYEEAQLYQGFLDKKAKHLFSGWQKRYFRILDGKIMVYSEKKEDTTVKGQINIQQISMPESIGKNEFKFTLEGRVFTLRAKNAEDRDKWVQVLKLLKSKLMEEKKNYDTKGKNDSFSSNSSSNSSKKRQKKNKISNAGKITVEILKKHGFEVNKEEKISMELLKSKGIDKLINISDPKIKTRIYHGFIYKKHKVHDFFQKRWFFIFSERPLFDNAYLEDDIDLDEKNLKDWLKYDTLFYFKYESGDESSKNLGELELVNSHKVELLDKDDKFYLYLDIQDRRFDFYCDSKSERDIWFEVLKNSRRTAKEYQVSMTQHPRNIELLYNVFLLGEKDFMKKMEKEKTSIVKNNKENDDFDIFENNQKSLGNLIISTLDGCNSNTPPKVDLLKAYASYMNKEYLENIKTYWNKQYQEINLNDILKMSSLLFDMGEKLYLINVDDPNFFKNGKILTKIYMKKTYNNILAVIENILKEEREIKGIKDESKKYYTRGPNDLFELLERTFDLMKENKNKYLYESILNLNYSSIYQYLLGVETTLLNTDVILDKEYLLSMANNAVNITNLLNKLLEDIKNMKILNENEINKSFKLEQLMAIINNISQKAIATLIYYFINELGQYFKKISFTSIDLSLILIDIYKIFEKFMGCMNKLVVQKFWNEILKLTLYYYVYILITSKLKDITVEQIKTKLKKDSDSLNGTYEGFIGKDLTMSTTKILIDIHDFLDVSPYMISSSCLTLRQYVGPSFNLNMAKALINLRTDFKKEDINDAFEQCKEVLEKYNETNKEDGEGMPYFKIIENEIKRQAEEESLGNEKNAEKEGGQNTIMENIEEDEDINEEVKNDETTTTYNLNDFINNEEEEEEKEETNYSELIKYEEEDKEVNQEEVSDIVYEGFMDKKTYRKWQTRYFQLKNGYLFWFKDKNSSIAQNKISIKNTLKVESHKDKKFMMIVNFTDSGDKSYEEDEEKNHEYNGKVYKFSCTTDEEKLNWVNAITNEMKRLKKLEEKRRNYKLEIPIRKKVITDYCNFPEIKDINYMKKKVLEEMNREDFFQKNKRKMEMLQKKMQKEKEKNIQIENEKNNKIEQEVKNNKDEGITDKLKFWYNNKIGGLFDKIKKK